MFRRGDTTVIPSTKERIREQLPREARADRTIREAILDFDPFETPSEEMG